jgi:hypothetical protein
MFADEQEFGRCVRAHFAVIGSRAFESMQCLGERWGIG